MQIRALALAPLLLAALVLAPAAGAAAGPSAPPGPPAAAKGTVIADGLASPRFLAFGADGALYVSENGVSPDGEFPESPEAFAALIANRGATGKVSRIASDGTKTVVADNLVSGGPEGLVWHDGKLYLVMGGLGPGTGLVPGLPEDAAVLRIDLPDGKATKVADIVAYELAHNPDGFGQDSNPYGAALGADGKLYVADAGGNSLYRLDPASGELALVTSFAGLPGGEPNEFRGGKAEHDPVPTGVAAGPDGGVSDAATGLTFLGAVTVGPDGNLYVTEIMSGMDMSGEEPAPLPGRILRVLADGTKEVVADGLRFPMGTAFDRAGNLYAAVNAVSATDGQVLRFDGVAAGPAAGDAAAPTKLAGSANAALAGDKGGAYHYYELAAVDGAGVTLTLSFSPFAAGHAHAVGLNVYQDGVRLGGAHGTAAGLGDAVDSSTASVQVTPKADGGPLLIQVYNYGADDVTYTLTAS